MPQREPETPHSPGEPPLPLRIFGDSELLHQLVERRPADAKFHGGGSNLPSVPPQGVLDHLPFHTFPRLFERLRRQGAQGIGQFQVPGGDALAFRRDHRITAAAPGSAARGRFPETASRRAGPREWWAWKVAAAPSVNRPAPRGGPSLEIVRESDDQTSKRFVYAPGIGLGQKSSADRVALSPLFCVNCNAALNWHQDCYLT